jgi:lipoprotein-releasing system permease protein
LKLELYIGLRYLWNTRRTRFLSVITAISIVGVSIGVAALISVQSVMDGLQNHMKKTILGAKAHMVVENEEGVLPDYRQLIPGLKNIEGVAGATPVITRDVIISVKNDMTGGIVNGIDPSTAGEVLLIPSQIEKGSLECVKSPHICPEIISRIANSPASLIKEDLDGETRMKMSGVAIGAEMAKYFHLNIGDTIKIISPTGGGMGPSGPLPLSRSFQVAAIFFSGLYEYDFNFVYISLDAAKDFFSTGDGVDSIGIKLSKMYEINSVEKEMSAFLGEGYRINNWRDMNRPLFEALKMEKLVWFMILGFIVVIAAFNIISALLMMVMGKKIEIAILRAMGFTSGAIMRIFMLDGIVIGLAGTVIGMIAGYAGCVIIDGMNIGAAKEVFYMDSIPVDMSMWTFAVAGIGSVIITLAAAVYPGRKAALLNPAEALRHE